MLDTSKNPKTQRIVSNHINVCVLSKQATHSMAAYTQEALWPKQKSVPQQVHNYYRWAFASA
jgi:hypothetical protein